MSACAFPEFRPFKLTKKKIKKEKTKPPFLFKANVSLFVQLFVITLIFLSFVPTIKIMIIIQIAVLNKPISCFGLVKTELKDMRRIED